MSPKKQRRPLPSLLYKSLLCGLGQASWGQQVQLWGQEPLNRGDNHLRLPLLSWQSLIRYHTIPYQTLLAGLGPIPPPQAGASNHKRKFAFKCVPFIQRKFFLSLERKISLSGKLKNTRDKRIQTLIHNVQFVLRRADNFTVVTCTVQRI